MRWEVEQLEAAGVTVEATGPDTATLLVPFEFGSLEGELEVLLWASGNGVALRLLVEAIEVRERLFAEAALNELTDMTIEIDDDLVEIQWQSPDAGLERTADLVGGIQTLVAALSALVANACIDIGDASDDPEIQRYEELVGALARTDQPAALDICEDAIELAVSLGDSATAALFQIVAAEILLDLGEVRSARDAAERAWNVLGEPLDFGPAVTVTAMARARSGEIASAIQLVSAAAPLLDETDAAVLRGDLGVMLASQGQRRQAESLLEAATKDPALDDAYRDHFREQLAVLRASPGSAENNDPLNRIATLLMTCGPREMSQHRPEIVRLLAIAESLPEAGMAGQMAKIHLIRAYLAFVDADRSLAKQHFAAASDLAITAGDSYLAQLARSQSLSLLGSSGVANDLAELSPLDRAGLHFNAAWRMASDGDAAGAWGPAIEALELSDRERHRFESVASRRSWSELTARMNELALNLAPITGHADWVPELLERRRAQGRPRDSHDAIESTEQVDTDWALASLRADLGDVSVTAPVIASLRQGETDSTSGLRLIDLDHLVRSVGGPEAWWWSTQVFEDRLYWCVRSPDGKQWQGLSPTALSSLATRSWFASVRAPHDLETHPLFGSSAAQSTTLERAGRHLIPSPLAEEILRGASEHRPVRVVWSPAPQLATVPIGLLKVDEHVHVLDGAILVMAPPTSLIAATPARSQEVLRRPAVAVFGADADLGTMQHIAQSFGPASVMGPARMLREGTAGTLATPSAVRACFAANRESLVLYYGHIEQGELPHSCALRLTDGLRPARLDALQLLAPERRGAPHTVVLAGCSSLSAESAGSGEWWGLAAALLWQGSQHVVGSTWDLLAGVQTEEFVATLVADLRLSQDTAGSLRETQLSSLNAWRYGAGASPYLWAGWSAVSCGGESGS